MINPSIDLAGEASLERAFARVLKRAARPADALAEAGEYMTSETVQRFRDQRGPDGLPWVPSQRAMAEHGKTLIDRGHLRDSYLYRVSRNAVEIGSNMVYAAIHHFGGKAGRGHRTQLPPRPALGVSRSNAAAIIRMFERDIAGAWHGGAA